MINPNEAEIADDKTTPATNEERIKSMSTYQLSQFLCKTARWCCSCPVQENCLPGKNGYESWLEQPYKESE